MPQFVARGAALAGLALGGRSLAGSGRPDLGWLCLWTALFLGAVWLLESE